MYWGELGRYQPYSDIKIAGVSPEIGAWAKMEGVEPGKLRTMAYLEKRPVDWDNLLMNIDRANIGKSQLPAETVKSLGEDEMAKKIALLRIGASVFSETEVLGLALATYGLLSGEQSLSIIGLGVKSVSALACNKVQNKSGGLLRGMVSRVFGKIDSHRQIEAIRREVKDFGIDPSLVEPKKLEREVYMQELDSHAETLRSNLSLPILTALVLGTEGEGELTRWIGGLTAAIGLFGIGIGEVARRSEIKEKRPAHELAASANVDSFTKYMSRKHELWVTGLAIVQELPTAIQVGALALTNVLKNELLGIFVGLGTVASVMGGSLMRARSHAERIVSTKLAKSMIEYLTSENSPILSAYNRGINNKPVSCDVESSNTDGVILNLYNFKPIFGHSPESGITQTFTGGEIIRLVGKSGFGKTVFAEAIRQIYNFSGVAGLQRDGEIVNVGGLSGDELGVAVVAVSKDNQKTEDVLVVDVARDMFAQAVMMNSKFENNETIMEVRRLICGLGESDRKILFRSDHRILKQNASNSYLRGYSQELIVAIKPFLDLKETWVNQELSRHINGEMVSALSSYSELSTGQKQRVMNMPIYGALECEGVEVLILDEVARGLDIDNKTLLIENINILMKESDSPPIIFWIEHEQDEQASVAKKVFGDKMRDFDVGTGEFVYL